MSIAAPDEIAFRYTAVDRTGRQVRDVVRARDARSAARALIGEGLTPITVVEEKKAVSGGSNRDLNFAEKVSVLRQLALMVEAGVGLLEAMQTVAAGIAAAKGKAKFEAVITGLKRGDRLAHAMEVNAPGFPFYLYAMLRVGESTGRVAEVLQEAADQMAYEHKLRRDFIGSLIYPAFLIIVALIVMVSMVMFIVPKFSDMIGEDRSRIPYLSQVVFGVADFMNHNILALAVGFVAFIVVTVMVLLNPSVRVSLYNFARGVPGLGGILKARELGSWAKVLAFALSNGVGLLEAATLARQAAPPGEFNKNLDQFERDLKSGVEVAESLSRHTRLTSMDLSLIRAGSKSGALARMFTYVAEGYDATLRDRLKTLSAFVQPAVIIFVAIIVATLVMGIMMALLSVYQSIA